VGLAALVLAVNNQKENKMKLLLILSILMLVSCSSTPRKYLMRNCEAVGSDLYKCEEIPHKEIEPHGRGI
jgi:hypothetical protein